MLRPAELALDSNLSTLEAALVDAPASVVAMFAEGTDDVPRSGQTERSPRAAEDREQQRWFTRLLLAVHLREFDVRQPAVLPALQELVFPVPEESSQGTEGGWSISVSQVQSIEVQDYEPIESVTLNRRARTAVVESRRTVKADAAGSLFDVSCAAITWAVLDSGIDAQHPAFALRDPDGKPLGNLHSRVTATYDFTKLREILADYEDGRADWHEIEGLLWRPPDHTAEGEHGTHVAGVLGGDWPEEKLRGICPDIRMWDIRVLEKDGTGDEFTILAALQFLRWKNERSSRPVVAGANLSFALKHEVANYSCGWTPVCVEADKLVRSGAVVVTVAGNAAFADDLGTGFSDGASYRPVSITDPGNTESVITVGATHRTDPHRHGVSFFSGRGPTADGRTKPDLLAPGERIDGPIPNGGIRRMTGTSQAAPHVSGAAAMLMARHRELLGRPDRVKDILCQSATDLGRTPAFQGNGLLDVLRAMQAL